MIKLYLDYKDDLKLIDDRIRYICRMISNETNMMVILSRSEKINNYEYLCEFDYELESGKQDSCVVKFDYISINYLNELYDIIRTAIS